MHAGSFVRKPAIMRVMIVVALLEPLGVGTFRKADLAKGGGGEGRRNDGGRGRGLVGFNVVRSVYRAENYVNGYTSVNLTLTSSSNKTSKPKGFFSIRSSTGWLSMKGTFVNSIPSET